MKKEYVKPEVEVIDLFTKEMLMNGGIIDGSIGNDDDYEYDE